MIEEHPETPIAEAKSLSELNIHIGYIRQAISDNRTQNKANFQELKEQISLQSHTFVLQDEFKPIQKDVVDHEVRIRALEIWKYGLAASIALIGFLVANNFLHIIK